MFEILTNTEFIMTFFLSVIRISGIIFSAPVLGSNQISPKVKMSLSILMALIIAPIIEPVVMPDPNPVLLGLVVFKELFIGMATGLLALFLFVGVQTGAQIMGFQMGFSIVNVIDPQTNQNMSIIAQFKNIAMLLVFISVGGHYLLLGAIAESFRSVPLGVFNMDMTAAYFLVDLFSMAFVTAFKIAAPVFVTLLCVHSIMGFIGKFVPQLNIMIVGFPIQIASGMLILSLSMGYFYIVFEKIMRQFFADIVTLFGILGG